MASVIPKEVKKAITDGWHNETLYAAFFQSTSNCATDGTSTYAGCTNECTGAGYAAGGKSITTSSAFSSTDAVLDATDKAWTGLTLTQPVVYVVIYVKTGTNAGKIRFVLDLGTTGTITGGTIVVQWNVSGICKVS